MAAELAKLKDGFNPRTPEEVRPGGGEMDCPICSFNPRTPEEVRRCRRTYEILQGGFNPRTPEEVRLGIFSNIGETTVSIHAPPKRCDSVSNVMDDVVMFQSTHPRRGATPIPDCTYRETPCFNPRTPEEVRRIGKRTQAYFVGFNPRTPEEVRRA